jgi:[acyl-carrier-protein] S-malonyltransferase
MESIIPGMTEALSKVKLHKAEIPIIANSSAKPIARPEEIREESIIQLSSAVQWQASIEYMINEGVCTFVEIGPGDKVLSGLIRRIDSDVEVINIKEI